jgi:hypothetical protein
LSIIIQDLWKTLESQRTKYEHLIHSNKIEAYAVIGKITSEVGERYRVILQINIPPGEKLDLDKFGHHDLTLLVHRGRENFQHVSEDHIEKRLMQLHPLKIEKIRTDKEGFRVQLVAGQILCLPSGVHLWCEINSEVLQLLDWLFENEYDLVQRDQSFT